MRNKIKESLSNILNTLKISANRFPESITLAITLVVLMINLYHLYDFDFNNQLGKIVLTFILGFPITVSFTLLNERFKFNNKIRLIVDVLIVLILFIYYFIIPRELDIQFVTRYITVNFILYFIFTLVPYFYNRKNYSIYVLKLILSFLTTYLYVLVLYFGLFAIIFTINQLFYVNINDKIYFDLFLIAFGIFGSTFYLGNLPKYETNVTTKEYPKILKVLIVSIVMPLLIVYTIVLYAYFFKILVTVEWPQGIVGHLVLWYGFISVAALVSITEMDDNNEWVNKFKKYYPITFTIPLIMMLIAIFIRINSYGLTLLRYYVVISAIWFGIVMLIYIIRINNKVILTVSSLLIIMFISIYGPLSGLSLSYRSQNNRLEHTLNEYEMLENNKLIKRTDLTNSQKQKIVDSLLYFDSLDALDHINLLPNDFEINQTEDLFGFKFQYYYNDSFNYSYHEEVKQIRNIADYDYFLDFRFYKNNTFNVSSSDIAISINDNDELIITNNNEVIKKSLNEIAKELHEKLDYKTYLEKGDLTYTIENDYIEVIIELKDLYGSVDGDDINVESMNGKIWINIK